MKIILIACLALTVTTALPGFCNEVAVPDVKLLGKSLISLDKCFLIGVTNAVFPDHMEFEVRSNNIASIVAVYPKGTSLINLKNAISKQLGFPKKEFEKESGGKLYEWREESSHIAALFSEKSERDQCPMIIVSYIGKTFNTSHQP